MPTKAPKQPVNFYIWLRSGLRSLSRKWPAIYEALAAAKVPYKGDNPRRKWSYVCAACTGHYDGKMVSVDHKIPTGQLSCKEDIADFVEKLYCSASELQVLCDSCHSRKTYSERYAVSLDEADVLLEVARLLKKENSKEALALLTDFGYTCSNAKQRRAALVEILTKQSKEK